MRVCFFKSLHAQMQKDKDIYFITADLGFGLANQIKEDFPDRFFNVQAAEMAMAGIAVGLALQNKKPFIYSITPFLLFRTTEIIRNYIDKELVPVRLIGSGRGDDYCHDKFSHHCGDDINLLNCFKNINCYWPETENEIEAIVTEMINNPKPYYLNLKR